MSVEEIEKEAEDLGLKVEEIEKEQEGSGIKEKARKRILQWVIAASIISLSSCSVPVLKKNVDFLSYDKPGVTKPRIQEDSNKNEPRVYFVEKKEEIPKDLNSLEVKVSDYAVIVDKSEYKLSLYLKLFDEWRFIKKYEIATGLNNGDKEKLGDERTPEGIYYITHVMTTIKNSSYYNERLVGMNREWHRGGKLGGGDLGYDAYGNVFLGINYPNKEDVLIGKTGSGIGIHGTCDTRSIGKNASKGCIRMYNPDIEELAYFVKPGTPIIIRNKIGYSKGRDIVADAMTIKCALGLMDIQRSISSIRNDFERLAQINNGRLLASPKE